MKEDSIKIGSASGLEHAGSGVRPRLLLLLRSLNRGGAERQAVTLARGLQSRGWTVSVACFYVGGQFQHDLDHAGVPVIDLAKRSRWDLIGFSLRWWRTLRRERPDIVYGFLPVPNLVALLGKFCCKGLRVVWGICSSNIDLSHYDWTHRWTYWLERHCAGRADMVIANSDSGARLRIASGFPAAIMRVIPNGIDTVRFRFDAEGRARVRKAWAVPDGATLVGIVGRLDPMKDHPTFLAAAAILAERDKRWHFACIGDGPEEYKARLIALADKSNLQNRLIWAGARDDMPAVYSALDIATSSSFGEGFANVIAEAMACGRPCVVTDVGDSAVIVGNLGIVVPPRDPIALSGGIKRMQKRSQGAGVGETALIRERIVAEFSVARLVQGTEQALLMVLGEAPATEGPLAT